MNETQPTTSSALQRFEPMPEKVYSIEAVVHITQTPRHLIAVYCRHGLITPIAPPESEGWQFDDEAIRELRRIECLRTEFGLPLPALRMMTELQREVERLRDEVRFLRGR
jgi:DNA-binding transcriptional MerR regulator